MHIVSEVYGDYSKIILPSIETVFGVDSYHESIIVRTIVEVLNLVNVNSDLIDELPIVIDAVVDVFNHHFVHQSVIAAVVAGGNQVREVLVIVECVIVVLFSTITTVS